MYEYEYEHANPDAGAQAHRRRLTHARTHARGQEGARGDVPNASVIAPVPVPRVDSVLGSAHPRLVQCASSPGLARAVWVAGGRARSPDDDVDVSADLPQRLPKPECALVNPAVSVCVRVRVPSHLCASRRVCVCDCVRACAKAALPVVGAGPEPESAGRARARGLPRTLIARDGAKRASGREGAGPHIGRGVPSAARPFEKPPGAGSRFEMSKRGATPSTTRPVQSAI